MKAIVSLGLMLATAAASCAGGSDVSGNKSLVALSDAEYTKVCTYYNTKADEISAQTCSSNMRKPAMKHVPCGMTNLVKGSGTCAAKVSDMDSCINGLNACSATGVDTPPNTCPMLGNCFNMPIP